MSDNREFYESAQKGKISLRDIFSEVLKKHTPEQTALVFTAGTPLTSPTEKQMLANWNRPFLFARFLLAILIALALSCVVFILPNAALMIAPILILVPLMIPMTLLLLVWEMNIPRNISLYEVLKYMLLGGTLSLVVTLLLFTTSEIEDASLAGLVEEPGKLVAIYLILRKKKYPYILNGILVGAAVGAGFAIFESLGYVIVLGVAASNGDLMSGLWVALIRALCSIPGHSGWAAMYGGALVLAQCREPLSLRHLFRWNFLKYFTLAILLHAAHNSQILSEIFPAFLGGLLNPYFLILAIIWFLFFLPMLRIGVNEIVQIAITQNEGHLTEAIHAVPIPFSGHRPASAPKYGLAIDTSNGRQLYPLRQGSTILGRKPAGSNIVLMDYPKVSGIHCRIFVDGDTISVTDLGSTNGTFLNGKKLSQGCAAQMQPEAELMLADANCIFRLVLQ